MKHRELISGPNLWSPKAQAYVPFNEDQHGTFALIKPQGPTTVNFIGKLVPVYCRLCFLTECHERAQLVGQTLLAYMQQSRSFRGEIGEFEIRALQYLIDNLSASPPPEWGVVARSSDVAAYTKIAVDLLWAHLVLLYAGKRKLLLYNIERFFITPQNSLLLCPNDLRAALFVHGKHEPVSKRRERSQKIRTSHATRCPALPLKGTLGSKAIKCRSGAANRLHETRCSRLCWLGALWILDVECNKNILHWLYKPEPHRA